MAANIDYTQKNIPPWQFMVKQADMLPPDAKQLASAQVQPGEIPPYLLPDPKSAPGVYAGRDNSPQPQLPPLFDEGGSLRAPQDFKADLAKNTPPVLLQQTPAVGPIDTTTGAPSTGPSLGLAGYIRPNRELEKAQLAGYNTAAQRSLAEQGAGVDQIQQYIRDLQGQPQAINWTPLAAYIDAHDPNKNSNLTAAAKAMAPMTPEEKQQMLMGLQFKLQGAKQAMSKDQLDALANQIKMQHQNYMDDAMIQHYQNEDKANALRSGGFINSREAQSAERQYLGDRLLTPYKQRYDGAIKIANLMDAAEANPDAIKSNKALLGQLNAEIGRLETGSQSPALSAQEKTEMNDAAATMRDYYDTLTGGVSNVDLHAKYQQARGMIGDLAQSYRDQIDARHQELLAGATPVQQQVFNAKIGAWQAGANSRIGRTSLAAPKVGTGTPATAAGGDASHPPVTQNGVTYTWNPKTGGYE